MDRLLGNDALKRSLSAAFAADRISHCYLISGPAGSGKHTLARLLAAAMECTAGDKRPCGQCLQCRKVLDEVHPDLITVDDPDRKTVGVDLIRRARTDLYVRPNEGRRKIYLIPRAADLNANAQNALLKVMEEPPDYGAFLLLSESAEKLLPTIRSRCVCLHMAPLEAAVCVPALAKAFPGRDEQALRAAWRSGGGFYGPAAELLRTRTEEDSQSLRFAEAFAQRDRLALTELLVPMERLKRDQAIPVFRRWAELLTDAVGVRSGMPEGIPGAAQAGRARTPGELLRAARSLLQAVSYLEGNASVGAVCGALQVWLIT